MRGMDIKRIVDLKYGVNTGLTSRKREIVIPRWIAIYLCRRNTKLSYLQIARLFGLKDHSTVMYAEAKIEEMCDNDKFKREIESII